MMWRGTPSWPTSSSIAVTAIARWIPITRHYFTDADTIRVPAGTAQTRDILWQPARSLSDLVNTTSDDYEPRLTADGLTLYFVRGRAGENADIYVSVKSPDGWSEPAALAGVISEYDDLGPEPSSDGKSIYFYSDRPGGHGGYDLWVAHRGIEGWQTPINLGPGVNSEFNDYGPALTPGGDILYFASNRPAPKDSTQPDPNAWPATLREDLFQRTYDLYQAAVTERGFGSAIALSELNTPYNDGAPAVSSFGDFLYFASDRPGGEGAFDLYRSRRLRGGHEPARTLGAAVNTAANELDPGMSLGGYALYFSSDRFTNDVRVGQASDGEVGVEPARAYNLYYTTSREVFAEREQLERPPIDWAALWSMIGPNLLWALLALLLLLLFLALLRDMQKRRMGLLAKCMLGSVMAHLLLMLLLNTWEVTAALAREFRRRGPIRVALASNDVGDELSSQIRGQLTSITPPEAPTVQLERQMAQPEMPQAAAMASLTIQHQPAPAEEQPTIEDAPIDAAVEQRLVRPTLADTQVDVLTPPPLETALPTDAARTEVREPDTSELSERLASSQQFEVQRAASRTVESTSISAAMTAELRPDQSVRNQERLSDRESMVPTTEASDASSRPAATPIGPGRFAASADIPLTDIPLPMTDVQRLPESTETQLTIAVPASVAPRREFADASAQRVTVGNMRHIQPGASPQSEFDTTFIHRADAALSDATPFNPTPADEGPPASASAMPALEQIDLAMPESPTAGQAVERSFTPEPSLDARQRLPASETSDAVATTIARVEFAPDASDAPTDDQSFAETSNRLSEVTATGSTSDDASPARSPAADPAFPSLVEIELPALEQSSLVSEGETEWQVASVESVVPRASVPSSDRSKTEMTLTDLLGPAVLNDDEREEASLSFAEFSLPAEMDDEPVLLALDVPHLADFPAVDSLLLELDVPTETRPPENPYLQRLAEDRMSIVERKGGSAETERAVADALRWLAEHQSADGHWDGREFDRRCGGCGGETQIVANNAMTGLALLAFLGSGHTHVSDGPYRSNVERAVRWLAARQKPNGDLRGAETMYSHGIATIALSEAYGMSGDASLSEPVRKAARFIDGARNTDEGGWRYDPGQPGDTSVLGWQVMALKSATLNGIRVPAESFNAARRWLERVERGPVPGLYRYRAERKVTPSMTAEGMFTQQLLGRRRDDERMVNSAAYVLQHLPDWDEANTYYWYYATLALFQHQGDAWQRWNEAVTTELLSHQRRDGPAAGSWDPDGEWADMGGRIYQTALCTLMLEVYYRYLPLYSIQVPEDAIGIIEGIVTDARSQSPLAGATVHVDLPDREPVSAVSDQAGHYELFVPEVPDFFAITASRSGYIPDSRNVDAAMLQGRTLSIDFNLDRVNYNVISIEVVPEVHHLGDNRFEGRINSQFQKESEGDRFSAEFELSSAQQPPAGVMVELRLLAKGVQRSHKIAINDTVLDDRLDDAPDDGSFGEFTARFDAQLLRVGINVLEIIAKPSSSDIDDFEFVNVQIHLSP